MKIRIQHLIILLFVLLLRPDFSVASTGWNVKSPSGKIKYTVTLNSDKQLTYCVKLADTKGYESVVVNESALGLKRSDALFSGNFEFVSTSNIKSSNDSFTMPHGKQMKIASSWNELKLTFKNDQSKQMELLIRAYNDGVAFRYRFPENDKKTYTVEDELTGFAMGTEGKTWIEPYAKVTMYSPGYEKYFEDGIPIGTSATSEEGWCFPALFQTPKAWVMLTEAANDSTYFASHLQPQCSNGIYIIRKPEATEANNTGSNLATSTLPWATPWRVIMISDKLSDIVESNIVLELNPKSLIKDVSWIKPGRSSWSWWSVPQSPKEYNSLLKFVDFSKEMGWEYSLVDANWDMMEGGNIQQVINYANSKNVGILMWYNSGGPNNTVTERPRDIMNDPIKRKEEFKKLASWGVKGVKVDFFQSDKQFIMKQFLEILKDAADNKILVNFHGCTIPHGWSRTWPNLVSTEAILGAENYIFDSNFPSKAPVNNVIAAFTRNVVGPMDYTPVTFSNHKMSHLTSFGHELALSVLYETAIIHYADHFNSYQSQPAFVIDFLKNVPTVWDKTVLLDGYPGKYCVIARKLKNTWYIAGINGTNNKVSLSIDLSRLQTKNTTINLITDGDSDKALVNKIINYKKPDKLTINLIARGGFVAAIN